MTKRYAYLMKGMPTEIGKGQHVLLTDAEIKKGRKRFKKTYQTKNQKEKMISWQAGKKCSVWARNVGKRTINYLP